MSAVIEYKLLLNESGNVVERLCSAVLHL